MVAQAQRGFRVAVVYIVLDAAHEVGIVAGGAAQHYGALYENIDGDQGQDEKGNHYESALHAEVPHRELLDGLGLRGGSGGYR